MEQEIDVAYVAGLAQVALEPGESARLQGELEGLLQYVGKIGEADVSGVEPTVCGLAAAVSAFREDTVENPDVREHALGIAPERNGLEFRLPKIVEDA
ncbi:MAG: Asp-tRNA(Asn)/Glu-tRNA(Gln) amidotransferase subunit GatC [Kiritimatiellaeota bacterium]|nr:Asp-tRNA(Asn)/Glu-tRNA(Gln) amidotransferase subunit GatC [Kiritimatiellota bacterium]